MVVIVRDKLQKKTENKVGLSEVELVALRKKELEVDEEPNVMKPTTRENKKQVLNKTKHVGYKVAFGDKDPSPKNLSQDYSCKVLFSNSDRVEEKLAG